MEVNFRGGVGTAGGRGGAGGALGKTFAIHIPPRVITLRVCSVVFD